MSQDEQKQNKARPVWRVWIIFGGETSTPRIVGPDIAYADNPKVIEAEPALTYIKQLEFELQAKQRPLGEQVLELTIQNDKLKLENERLRENCDNWQRQRVMAADVQIIEELKAELSEKDKVLEFYADVSKQVHISKAVDEEDPEIGTFIVDDFSRPKMKPEVYGYFQGKLAREVLKKYKKE
jgi:regulator of replication initiation timing